MLDTGGHTGKVVSLAFARDGNYLVSAGEDKVVRVWDWRKGETVRFIRGQAGLGTFGLIYNAALSPDNHWLAASGSMAREKSHVGDIRLYDFESGKFRYPLADHTDVVGALAFSPNGKQLLSGQGGNDLRENAILWDVESWKPLFHLKIHAAVNRIRFVSGARKAVIATDDGKLTLWSLENNGSLLQDITPHGHSGLFPALAVSPVSGMIAAGDDRGVIRFWDADGNFLKVAGYVCNGAGSLSFSPDERLLLATCQRPKSREI